MPAGKGGGGDRKNNGSRQKNKTGESKVESNNSSGIPDRGKTSDTPGLPSGTNKKEQVGTSVPRRHEKMGLVR